MSTRNEQIAAWRGFRSVLGPDWRFRLANQPPPQSAETKEDPGVRQLRAWKSCAARDGSAKAAARFSQIAAAAALQADPGRRDEAMLMAVGGLSPAEMGARLQTPAAVVKKWESYYFDVREVGHAFLEFHVARREQQAGRDLFAAKLRLATAGGAEGARAALDLDAPPLDEADRIVKRLLHWELKLDVALNAPLETEQRRLEFLRMHVRLATEQSRLELARARLSDRCAQRRERALEKAQRRAEREEVATQRAARRERAAEQRRRQQAAQTTARRADRERLGHQRRAEQLAAAARVAESPLSTLRWADAAGETPRRGGWRGGWRKGAGGTSSGTKRPPSRPSGRKIPPEVGRDHRSAAGRGGPRCVDSPGAVREVREAR